MNGMKRGPYKREERIGAYNQARKLRRSGFGYRSIFSVVKISWETVKDWVAGIHVDRKKAHRKAMRRRRATKTSGLKTRHSIMKVLIRTRGRRCSKCGISRWRGRRICLEVHHMNGVRNDNADENVCLLCPNCHSQTPTWKNKKRDRGVRGAAPA
jgi:hypothetical protein